MATEQPFVVANGALGDPTELRSLLEVHSYLYFRHIVPEEPIWPDPVCGTRFYESLWPATTASARYSSAYSAGVLYPRALCGRLRL